MTTASPKPDRRDAELLELRQQREAMETRSRWAERDVRRLTRLLDLAIKGCLDPGTSTVDGAQKAFRTFVVALAEWRDGKARRAAWKPEGTPATSAASELAEALLTPGNAGISMFAAHGGRDAGSPTAHANEDPQRWTVVWAKAHEADRLRAWLGVDDQEDTDDAG